MYGKGLPSFAGLYGRTLYVGGSGDEEAILLSALRSARNVPRERDLTVGDLSDWVSNAEGNGMRGIELRLGLRQRFRFIFLWRTTTTLTMTHRVYM